MDAILFKMPSRSIIIFAMVITLFFFLIKRKKFHNKLTDKEDTVLKIMAAKGNDRSVVIISIDDGHEEYIEFPYSKGIDKGDVLTVKYLPHSKYGILISINNDNVALE